MFTRGYLSPASCPDPVPCTQIGSKYGKIFSVTPSEGFVRSGPRSCWRLIGWWFGHGLPMIGSIVLVELIYVNIIMLVFFSILETNSL